MNKLHRMLKLAQAYVEKKTLQAHFRNVEIELLTQPSSPARNKVLNLLRDYRRRGEFPRNTRVAGTRAPFLRDPLGTSCAMAFLMEGTGKRALVDRLAAADNNIYMEDAKDPELLAWIKDSGLTQAEAARIQPGYHFNHDFGQALHGVAKLREAPRVLNIPAPAAQDETLLVLLGAVLAGAALWFAIRWFRQSRQKIKEPVAAPSESPLDQPQPA
jgi:hypothetical protein